MISIKEIYKSVISIIKSIYPSIPIVEKEVVEGHDKPFFYIQILPGNISNTSINYDESKYSIVITYFQKNPNSIVDMETFDLLKQGFGRGFKIDTIYAITSDYDIDYIGQDENIMQFLFNISYTEYNEHIYNEPIASEVTINNNLIDE